MFIHSDVLKITSMNDLIEKLPGIYVFIQIFRPEQEKA